MPQYVIEREMPGAGQLGAEDLKLASQTSCSVLQRPRPANPVGPQLRHRQQALLRLSRAERGHDPRACAARRLSVPTRFRRSERRSTRPPPNRRGGARRRSGARLRLLRAGRRAAREPSRGRAARGRAIEVWRDDELPAHRAYAEVIEERIKGASGGRRAVVGGSRKSQWVRAEADTARAALTLVQATPRRHHPADAVQPDPVRRLKAGTAQRHRRRLAQAARQRQRARRAAEDAKPSSAGPRRASVSICVLPFQNMSGDAEQEYFSDGISEDITTDLSKVSALEVIARNTAFTFKGQSVERLRGRARSSASATCSKAACARPATGCASPPS